MEGQTSLWLQTLNITCVLILCNAQTLILKYLVVLLFLFIRLEKEKDFQFSISNCCVVVDDKTERVEGRNRLEPILPTYLLQSDY